MDVGKKPFCKSFRVFAVCVTLTLCTATLARADQIQWSTTIAHAVAASVVTQIDSEPVAIFSISPQQPVLGVAFRADASYSYDRPSNGPIASYAWNWGDGSTISNGVSVQHTYNQAGRFTITLTVFDSATPTANSDTATQTVVIAGSTPPPDGGNHAPTAALTVSPTSGEVGDEITFDASGSRDADSDPLVYRFTFGDGEQTEFSPVAVVTHQYDSSGTFSVRVTVRDDLNASSDLAGTVQILGPAADNHPPVALIATGPRMGAAPATLNFDGRISYDPDDDAIFYHWSVFIDDELYVEQSGSVVNLLFDQPGTYKVVLEVTDSNGATDLSEEEIVTISPHGDPVEPPPPAPIPQPEPPPPSYAQRPPAICGVGLLMPVLACLMGLWGGRRLTRKS